MRSGRRIAIVVLSLVLLVAGVVLGFTPARATLTEVAPQLRQINVTCGNAYLRHTPPTQAGDLVALPDEAGVLAPRSAYVANCDAAIGWRRWAAWALTVLGVLGLAITFATGRTPPLPGERRARRRQRSASRG
jgi:heme exporter protein D